MSEFYDGPGMVLLNRTGDTALTWNEENAANVLTFIKERMAEGYTFFIVEKKMLGLIKNKRAISDINEIKNRQVFLDDSKAEELTKQGIMDIATVSSNAKFEGVRASRDPEEVAKNQTYAVRGLKGG